MAQIDSTYQYKFICGSCGQTQQLRDLRVEGEKQQQRFQTKAPLIVHNRPRFFVRFTCACGRQMTECEYWLWPDGTLRPFDQALYDFHRGVK